MELKHRFVWLQVVDGEVRFEPGPEIPGPARLAVDPELSRFQWREPLEALARAFTKTTGNTLERIDRAVSVTARPGLNARPMQIIDLDDVAGCFRAVCSLGELATLSRVNLIIDAHHFAKGSPHIGLTGGARVQKLLGDFTGWLINAPDPLPNKQRTAKKQPTNVENLAERVGALESRVDDALSIAASTSASRH